MSFKQQVIEELETGQFDSISQAQRHYGIRGSETIAKWLRKYGKNQLCAKVVRVERPDEKQQISQLKKQIRQLQEALGQTQAQNVLNQEFLKIACEQLGQDVDSFKKKVDTRRFTECDSDPV
jgi:transposase-like protein